MARVHPIAPGTTINQRFHAGTHDGVDYKAPTGTPLRAAQSGVVKTGTGHPKAGTWVEVHAGGILVGYSHMSKVSVKPGQTVTAGQVIGYSGNTGHTTGPHLHFYVKEVGKSYYLDPVVWLAADPAPPIPSTKEVSMTTVFPLLDLSRANVAPVSGPFVGILQALLLAAGYGPEGLVDPKTGRPDNVAGALTYNHLGAFQVATNTGNGAGAADRIAGARTWAALLKQ